MSLKSTHYRRYGIPALAVVSAIILVLFALLLIELTVTIKEIGKTSAELRRTFTELRPELRQTVKQVKNAAFEIQAASKALKEETTDPQAITERQKIFRATNAILGQTSQALVHLNDQTLPSLTATVAQANALIRHSDEQINASLLPELTLTLVTTRNNINALSQSLRDLAATGTVTIGEVNSLMRDPVWQQTAANLALASDEGVKSMRNITAGTESLKNGAAHTEQIAADIREYTRTTSKARKATLAIQIVTALLPVAAFLK